MRVLVLGGVSIVGSDGCAVPVRSPRPRLILALLASRQGSVVGEAELIEAIWPDNPPASVRTAVQTYISALRDELEPDRPRRSPGRFVVREGRGYALRAVVEELDVVMFDEYIDRARHEHIEDRDEAVRLLDSALDLWLDPPFGEFADEPWALGAVTRLRERHASALESRFGLALDAGAQGGVLTQMDEAVQAYPYRERLAGQRMLALYRSGEQQAALVQYAATRRSLLDDLGLDPGRELQLLERAILAQDPALRTRDREPAVSAAVRATEVPRAKPLVGRDDELRALVKLADSERCLTIVGPGGVGKSSLVANVVAQCASAFDDRIHYVDLSELGGRDVLRSLAAAVRVVEHPLAPLVDSITDAIGELPTLLVVETCEVAVDDVGSAVSAVLAAPGARVLLTSQTPLRIQAERVFRLGPLSPKAAVALLTRSQAVSDDDLPAMEAISEHVGRLPLGLELAASRLEALGPTELLRGLGTGPDLLVGASDRPERQRSVRAAVEWSLTLLGSQHRHALAKLAAFSAPFSIEAAGALTDDVDHIGALVGELADRSLVALLPGSPTRFHLLDTVRAVVLEAAAAEVVDAARTSLAEITLEAAQARMFGVAPPVDLDQLHGEVVPAITRFGELDDSRQLTLAGLLGMFFIEQGRIGEGREQLGAALEGHKDAPDLLRLLAVTQLGFLTWYQGDMIATRRVLSDMGDLVDHAPSAGFASLVSGGLAFVEGRFDEAATGLCAAIDSLSGQPKQHMMARHVAGNACWYAGDHTGAALQYRAQREIARSVEDQFYLAQALRFEAMVAVQLGEIEPAWRWAERSLSMARAMADSVSMAQALAASAVVASVVGVDTDAIKHAVDAVSVSRRHFDVFALRTAVPIVADASERAGDPVTAARLLGWYFDLLDRTGQTASPATSHLVDTPDRVRDSLGRAEFARVSAKGAAGGLGGVIEDTKSVSP